jgi:ketosteroid isomerase-like protein
MRLATTTIVRATGHFRLTRLAIVVAIIIASGLSPSPRAHGQGGREQTIDDIMRLEKQWDEAHLRSDAAALDALWAPDLEVAVPRMTPMSKADALAFAKSGKMTFQQYQSSETKVRVYGDAAVTTGRIVRRRTMTGKELEDVWRYTKVYVRQAGAWRVVAFHASDAAQ